MKKKFNFIIDEKIKCWIRGCVIIEADSEEEALELAKEGIDSKYTDIVEYEFIPDTEEKLPISRKDFMTLEIMDMGFKSLYTNEQSLV